MDNKYGSPLTQDGAIGSNTKTQTRIIAESIAERRGEWLIDTIEYYLETINKLELQLKTGVKA